MNPPSSRTIVVAGANGRLGAALVRAWRAAGEQVIGLSRRELDLAWEAARLRATLEGVNFGVFVNCAAQTNVDLCERDDEEAFLQINAAAPTVLADLCRSRGARMVHISTDYVFDGRKTTPYTEDDPAEPINLYGASKRAGEAGVLAATEGRGLVVRVSWVFGPDKPSFVDQIVQRARIEEKVGAVSDKVSTPTYTLDAAPLLRPFLFEVPEGGLLHLCQGGQCTWQEYGQHALDCAVAAGVPLKTRTVEPLAMSAIKAFIAKRPVNTALSTEKLTRLTGNKPRDWRDAVEEHIRAQAKVF